MINAFFLKMLYKLKKIGIYENHPQAKQINQLKNNVKKIAMKNGFSFLKILKSCIFKAVCGRFGFLLNFP